VGEGEGGREERQPVTFLSPCRSPLAARPDRYFDLAQKGSSPHRRLTAALEIMNGPEWLFLQGSRIKASVMAFGVGTIYRGIRRINSGQGSPALRHKHF
jgi:hypothetical protein